MGLLLWVGLLGSAIVGCRADRLKTAHAVGILLATLLLVFVRFEMFAKQMAAQGLSADGIWGWDQFLFSWLTAAAMWGFALLIGAWIGSRRRLKKALP